MKQNKKPVIAYLHTHWDREWYRCKEEFNLRLLEVFDDVLKELESGTMPVFYFDGQTAALEDYLKFRPSKLETVKKMIDEKKLFIGPFYVSPDSFLVSCASLVKNLDFGINYSKNLGLSDFIGYLSDTFGHSKGIFDILKAFNIQKAVIWRGAGAIPCDFKANGIDTVRLAMGYFMDVLHSKKPYEQKAAALEEILEKIDKYSKNIVLLPIGADHLAVLKNSKKCIDEVNKFLHKYEIKLSSPFEYLKQADFSSFEVNGEFLDNSETYILPGVYSSRTPQKVLNAKAQHQLFKTVEILDFLTGSKYRTSLEFASKELIKNHAHDSIYGCSVDSVHKHVQDRLEKVLEISGGVKCRIIRDFKRKFIPNNPAAVSFDENQENKKTKNKCNIGIFNISNFEYSGTVRVVTNRRCSNMQLIRKYRGFPDEILYDSRQIPVTEDYLPLYEYITEVKSLQPFSFTTVECVKIQSQPEISENKISNSLLELTVVRQNGEYKVNIKDKSKNNTLEDVLNLLITRDLGDSYNYAPASKPLALKLLRTKVIEKGPVRACLRLIYENKNYLDVLISNNSEFFEFRANINNNKKNQKIQVSFNLKSPVVSTIAEDTTGLIKRKHDPCCNLYDNMPVKTRGELVTNSYPMQRFVTAQGIGVLSEGLNEYEIYKNSIKIALIRGTGVISNPKNPARFVPAGPPIETPDLQCLGVHQFRFAFAFNNCEKEFFRLADWFMGPLTAFFGEFSNFNKKFVPDLSSDILFHGIKYSGDKAFAILYNIDDTVHTAFGQEIKPKTLVFVEFKPDRVIL